MIDGFRFYFNDTNSFEKKITESNFFDFSSKYSITTGEIKEYPKTSEFNGVKIHISKKYAFIAGSLHKFYNKTKHNHNQNFDDFRNSQIRKAISDLEIIFGKPQIDCAKITMLEMGFNLKIKVRPKDLISYRILMYNFDFHDLIESFRNKGFLKEFRRSDYRWKIYDKSMQYNLNDAILRVELKITNKRILERYNIHNPRDILNNEKLKHLFNFYMKEFDKLLIIDASEGKLLTKEDLNFLTKITSGKYWSDFTERQDSKKVVNYRKKKAREFLIEKKLNNTHTLLSKQIKIKFNDLLQS